jgi:glycyl-tRNA synthetase
VVETSIGLDRLFLALLSNSYTEETLQDGSQRTVLKLPASLAPVKAAILPLVNKDGLTEKALEVFDRLKYHFLCQFDLKDAIGRRYRRQDAIGTPYCITVDHQTLEDSTVTLRDRDSMEQERISIENLTTVLKEKCSMQQLLNQL